MILAVTPLTASQDSLSLSIVGIFFEVGMVHLGSPDLHLVAQSTDSSLPHSPGF